MGYLSVREAALAWGCTPRWVQQCCKEGLIPGVTRVGRAWLIPGDARKPVGGARRAAEPMPLTNGIFLPGDCCRFIEEIPQEDARNIAWAEYFHFSGQPEQAVIYAEIYLDHADPALRISATMIYALANMTLGRLHASRYAAGSLREDADRYGGPEAPRDLRALSQFAAAMGSIPLRYTSRETALLEILRDLPPGMRLTACYFRSHFYTVEEDYSRALGIAETALGLWEEVYPLPVIYLRLAAAMALMGLKRIDEAKEHFQAAWELARPDDLIQPFVVLHGLLQGLVEVCLKPTFPRDYERITAVSARFSSGWRKVHNPETQEDAAAALTTSEFTVAMLANRGWTNKEIAAHMGLSANTIKSYLSIIYQKLGISNRNQLKKYILR